MTIAALLQRLEALETRLLTSSSLLSVSSDHDALGFHPSPEIFLGPGPLINKGLRVAGGPRQNHWIGEATHANGQRSDQDTSEGDGQPCGDTFISPKYTCRIGLNTATSLDLNVHLEGDSDRVDDIKRAIMYYTNTPNRIKDIQARIAIQAGWSISVHGYTQDERLSRLALDRVALKEIRKKAELLENYIEKAPKYEGDVHRGVFFGSSKDAQSFIDDLQNSVSASVDSWSARRVVAEDFSGINEPKSWQRAAVVLTQKNKHGASIKRYSAIPEEDEVLQPSGLRYRVISITERVEGSLARPLTIYEVEVEAIEHQSMQRKTVLDSFFARLDALEERFDARRRAEAPGQLGLDFSAAAPASRKGPGGGEKCGQGWIDPKKKCHKGEGEAPIDPPNNTRRSRPVEPISFDPPLKGPSGAELLAYEWQWMMDSFQDSHGEEQLKRVSNWDLSEQNAETGRRVVHQFKVRKPDGSTSLVSSETAVKLLGYATPEQQVGFKRIRSIAQTIAKLEMEKAQLQQEYERVMKVFDEVEKLTPPEPRLVREEWGLRWQLPDSLEEMPAETMPQTVGGRRRPASTPEEAYLMPHEKSHMISGWQAERVGERLGRRYMPTRGSLWNSTNAKVEDLNKRIKKARKRLEAVVAAEAHQGADRIDSMLARLDALKRRCSTGYSCGSTCITVKKECRKQAGPGSRERIQRLEQLARGEIKPRGIFVPKPAEAKAMAGKLRAELKEQQALVKAERKRQQAAAAAAGVKKPKVIVRLRRAKPGGETGPDGHWYPGGAWMSEGSYVGAKPLKPLQGDGEGRDQKEKPKDGNREPRVIRPKRPSFRKRPTKPKGEGLPRPTGLKKLAAKNDELFFGDDGYVRYPQPKGAPDLTGTLFEAAVTQRMTTEELNWATEQIRQQNYRSTDPERRKYFDDAMAEIDNDIAFYGGPEAYGGPDGHRWSARLQLTGVDAERYIAGRRFMAASRLLSDASPARQRRHERYRDPRFEDWIVPEEGDYDRWVWGLNNVFRAVRIRRGRA